MCTPMVSIIVPVYNVEKYLPCCLESLINQTLKDIEIICVNDGSTDRSVQILKDYQKKDDRIFVINQENQGVSQTRNNALKYVRGKYTLFIDGDDWIDLEACETAVNVAEENSADLVFWSYVREYGEQSQKKNIFSEKQKIFEGEQIRDELQRRMCGLIGEELEHPENANALEPVWGKLYLSRIILDKDVRFVDLKEIGTSEDGLFNFQILEYVHKAVFINEYYNHYRKDNETSVTTVYKAELKKQWNTLFDKMQNYIQIKKLPASFETALNNRIALSILGLGLNVVQSKLAFKDKIKEIKDILSQERYREAYKQLDFQYFPIHWKLFYWCAKRKFAVGVWALLVCIKTIIGK